MSIEIRPALPTDLDALARLWYDVWHETHAPIMPAALAGLRTLQNFRDRLEAALPDIRVSGKPGSPLGFSLIRGDELYQLYLSPAARGTGIAAALLADAESRIEAVGYSTAWLACAIGNETAAKFYSKHGWRLIRTERIEVETAEGLFPVDIWRFEKPLT